MNRLARFLYEVSCLDNNRLLAGLKKLLVAADVELNACDRLRRELAALLPALPLIVAVPLTSWFWLRKLSLPPLSVLKATVAVVLLCRCLADSSSMRANSALALWNRVKWSDDC